ncbi:hypothetical protein BJX64DRAFT_160610 [Aspergillus heterothallicus]
MNITITNTFGALLTCVRKRRFFAQFLSDLGRLDVLFALDRCILRENCLPMLMPTPLEVLALWSGFPIYRKTPALNNCIEKQRLSLHTCAGLRSLYPCIAAGPPYARQRTIYRASFVQLLGSVGQSSSKKDAKNGVQRATLGFNSFWGLEPSL